MKKILSRLFLLFPLAASAEDRQIAGIFAQYHAEGTLVLSALHSGKTYLHNDIRAERRFSPASTFKIPNTLIALETKASTGPDDTFKWNEQTYDFPDWNHDQTLASAFKVSCVWCYQELARRVGAEQYRDYLRRMDYGHLQTPFETTTFWLDGSLQISPLEQIAFLKKLYRRSLPFGAAAYEGLRQIMLAEATPDFKLYAKTGWAARMQPQVGWYVGYVETLSEVWLFALNMNIHGEQDLPLRQKITREVLAAKGILKKPD
ncbi:beta-lactamase class D [Methylomagnum ishizawai]|uniref:Beta-lactamase n=1 Tax=Methylomagnum ishizawai TaxID=1760988 RepID=A0A1Y6CYZ9_9GAMM|nr:class D beta-lactamase [Methylomagnum ishizawai]SMF93783.1 beta-lactamase class D [Methylomagnum ishizawai]